MPHPKFTKSRFGIYSHLSLAGKGLAKVLKIHIRITSTFSKTSRGQKLPYNEKHKRIRLSLYGAFWPLLNLRQVMVTDPKFQMAICDFEQWSNGFRRFWKWVGHLIGRAVFCWGSFFVSSARVAMGASGPWAVPLDGHRTWLTSVCQYGHHFICATRRACKFF